MTTSEIIAAVKDVFLILAAIVASYVAWEGLKTWRKQLTGTAEYELAREVLKAVYKLRDRVDILRASRISFSEMDAFDLDKAFQDQPEVNSLEYDVIMNGEALRLRWPAVQEALSEFELVSIEAEVLFGQDVRKKLDILKRFVKHIANSSEVYYGFVERKEYVKAEKIGEEIFGYWAWNDNHSIGKHHRPPEFSIDEAIEALTPYLKKK